MRWFSLQARKNREIAQLQRKIDEVPSRTELAQYQRRFIELYNQGQEHSTLHELAMFTASLSPLSLTSLSLLLVCMCSCRNSDGDQAVLHSVQHSGGPEGVHGEGGETSRQV